MVAVFLFGSTWRNFSNASNQAGRGVDPWGLTKERCCVSTLTWHAHTSAGPHLWPFGAVTDELVLVVRGCSQTLKTRDLIMRIEFLGVFWTVSEKNLSRKT